MRLIQFKATKVHGFLKFNIEFFPELNFLIGINGSGKTSALKLILGLVSPSFNYLNQIDFGTATLVCFSERKKKNYTIIAKRTKTKITLAIKEENIDKASDSFDIYPIRFYDDEYQSEVVHEKLSRLRDEFDELKVVQEIRNLTTPIFLGLDRRIYEGKIIGRSRWHGQRHPRRIKAPTLDDINSSLEDVIELVHSFHRQVGAKLPIISEEFKNRIFKNSFDFFEQNMIFQISKDIESVNQRKEDLVEAIKGLRVGELENDIEIFFRKIDETLNDLKKYEKNKKNKNKYFEALSNWYINSPQIRRIDDIIKFSQEYQKQVSSLREPVRRLESIISEFFKESGKGLYVEPDGEIIIKLANRKTSNVFQLSSGEKQIVIMIAHLIFYEDRKQPGVFIIDEPELSLHLAWQEIFVESIQQASPKTQFILATHSPAIIGIVEREQFCKDLTKVE